MLLHPPPKYCQTICHDFYYSKVHRHNFNGWHLRGNINKEGHPLANKQTPTPTDKQTCTFNLGPHQLGEVCSIMGCLGIEGTIKVMIQLKHFEFVIKRLLVRCTSQPRSYFTILCSIFRFAAALLNLCSRYDVTRRQHCSS